MNNKVLFVEIGTQGSLEAELYYLN